ncbi:MAG: polyprenyl synthetase family protein, partial [Coriobacteriaceae bacterium]|nr:polyprenyl synthetase family protein [Coriobacteriaceae bacterium]
MAASGTTGAGAGDGGALFAAWLAGRRPRIEDYISGHLPAPVEGQGAEADLARYLYDPLARFT